MNRSRSDAVPEWFAQVMAPLIRHYKTEGGFTEDHARDYYAALGSIKPITLKLAVTQLLLNYRDPWMPRIPQILDECNRARVELMRRAISQAPDCALCENTGLVSAFATGAKRSQSFRCIACVRGWTHRHVTKFDPATMETWRARGAKLLDQRGPPKRLTSVSGLAESFSIPESARKSAERQREELAQWRARKETHRQEMEAGARELAEHSEKKGGRT